MPVRSFSHTDLDRRRPTWTGEGFWLSNFDSSTLLELSGSELGASVLRVQCANEGDGDEQRVLDANSADLKGYLHI